MGKVLYVSFDKLLINTTKYNIAIYRFFDLQVFLKVGTWIVTISKHVKEQQATRTWCHTDFLASALSLLLVFILLLHLY